jgi:hypothetical protein
VLLVEKIIIDQDSLQIFINTIHPGAYASVSKINFKALDRLSIKPIGVYGDKVEIVGFLQSVGVLDIEM